MSDALQSVRRSSLASVHESGTFGAQRVGEPGIVLSERSPLSIVQIEARAEHIDAVLAATADAIGVAPARQPNTSVASGPTRILGTGTGTWLVVEPERRDLEAHLRQALPDTAAVTDLSHGRTVIRIAGNDARTLLTKGTAIDVHPSVFTPDTSRMTGLFHTAVTVECRSTAPVFDIYVNRSFAVHLWELLLDGALEFGCRVE